jgi:hypothetical protein
MISSRVLLAALLALSAAAVTPAVTVAECMPIPATDDIRDYIGVAFTAKVIEVTDQGDAPMPDAAPFNWKVVLDVDRVYRGHVEETLHWNGWAAGCSGIRPNMLTVGDRLFVSTDALDPEGLTAPGHFTLLWKKSDAGWRFFPKALKYGYDDGWYPPEASRARSLRDLRQMVGALHRPYADPVPRQGSATDALTGMDAVEVDDPLGDWVDASGAAVDGPAYVDVTQMRVFVEGDRLVALFRPDSGPDDNPQSPDVAYTLAIDTDADGAPEKELVVYADGEAWAATLRDVGSTVGETDGVRPLVTEYGIGAMVDLDLLGPTEDMRFVGQAAGDGVFDNVADDPDVWFVFPAEG